MKFIHCADIHLGSKIDSKLNREKSLQRRQEVRKTFNNIVELAKDVGACAILLAGDVFDSDRPLKKDKEFFYSVVKNNPEIDFLYLRGNHDKLESFTESYDNLITFSQAWQSVRYDGVTVTAIEITGESATSMYSTLNLNKNDFNIVMLHGQVSDKVGKDLVNLTLLKNKNINYLALGHVHSYREDVLENGCVYAYAGSPEGRGFDEPGDKGVIVLNVENGRFQTEFKPLSQRKVHLISVDVEGLKTAYEMYQKILSEAPKCKSDLIRVEIYGEIDFFDEDLSKELESLLNSSYYAVSVKDKTVKKFVLDGDDEISLKNEFKNAVFESDLSSEEKQRVLALGLKALSGREIE